MNVKFLILVAVVVSMALLVPEDSLAKSKTHSGTKRILCENIPHATLWYNLLSYGVDEGMWYFDVTIAQDPGTCWYKNEFSKYYETPWKPIMTDVKLVDMDFDYTVVEMRSVGNEDATLTIPTMTVYEGIPYCLIATSTWMNVGTNEITEDRMCFTL